MLSASCGDLISTHQVRNEDEVCGSMKTLKISKKSVIPSKKRVLRPSFMQKRDKIAKLLVKKGAKIINNSKFLFNRPLYYAVRIGDTKLVEKLILEGADVNSSKGKRSSPLHVAAWRGHDEIVKLLIQNGARVDSVLTGPKKNGFTPLYVACLNNKVKCVKVLLKYRASITPKYESIYHPIFVAVFYNYVKITELLLKNGADVNLRFDNEFFDEKWERKIFCKHADFTLLHCSIARKYNKMTKLLLKYGADTHLNARSNKTSLMYAVEANDPELVKSLLAKGANPNDEDNNGIPVLFYILINLSIIQHTFNTQELDLCNEKIKIMKLLIDAGVDINSCPTKVKKKISLLNIAMVTFQSKLINCILYDTNFDYRNINLEAIESLLNLHKDNSNSFYGDFDLTQRLQGEITAIAYDLIYYTLSRYKIGLPVKGELLLAIETKLVVCGIPGISVKTLNSINIEIDAYITFLKETTIGTTKITFWRILTCEMTELVGLSFNTNVRSLCLRDYRDKIYWHYYMLQDRLDTAIKQSTSIEVTRGIIFDLFTNYLPFECCVTITKFFNEKEREDFLHLCNIDSLSSLG